MTRHAIVHTRSATLSERAAQLRAAGEAAQDFVDHSRADSSKVAYESDWIHFDAWCTSMGLASLPAEVETVYLYFSALAIGTAGRFEEGRQTRADHWSVASIMRRKSSIGRQHRIANLVDPTTHERVLTVLKGIRRDLTVRQERRRPFLSAHVCAIARKWDTGLLRDVRDRAIVLDGWFIAGRRDDITRLVVSSVEFVDEGAVILVGRSKSDQEGVGRSVGVPRNADPSICPVRALSDWRAEIQGDGPLFRAVSGKAPLLRGLNPSDVERVVRRAVAELALPDPDKYGAHSLRAGFITSATRAGKSVQWIMARSGHRSTAMVQRYVRDAQLFDRRIDDELIGV